MSTVKNCLALIAAGFAAYAVLVEPRWLDVRRIELAPPRWPEALDGLTVAHLSDLHLGAIGSAALVRRALAAVDSARPDLVVLTGDYTFHGRNPAEVSPALADLRSRPAFAVLGNHDYKAGPAVADEVSQHLRELGIVVLRNAAVECATPRGPLWIAGLDEHRYGRDDLAGTLGLLPTDGRPRLLLAHSPAAIHDLPEGAVDLILAGHTHGGQIRLPIPAALHTWPIFLRYLAGACRYRGTDLYVSRGLGSVGLPARFRSRPEVALITLRRPR